MNLKLGIYKFDSKRGPIATKHYSGRERSALCSIACLVFYDLLNVEDLNSFSLYLDYLYFLLEHDWNDEKINELSNKIYKWKTAFVKCFDPMETIPSGIL